MLGLECNFSVSAWPPVWPWKHPQSSRGARHEAAACESVSELVSSTCFCQRGEERKVSTFACHTNTCEMSDLITLSHIRHLHRDTDCFRAAIIQFLPRRSEHLSGRLLPTQVTSLMTVNMGRDRLWRAQAEGSSVLNEYMDIKYLFLISL